MTDPSRPHLTAYIPPQAGPEPADGSDEETHGGDALRILVVDDTREVRLLVGFLLEEEPSWSVVGEAGNGVEAIARAQETWPDLVLLDISMPVMDGLEALPSLRRLLPDALLVLLTAFPVGEVIELARACGADAVLDKVEMASTLLSTLRNLLHDKAAGLDLHAKDESRDG